jgi:hypothetical protein
VGYRLGYSGGYADEGAEPPAPPVDNTWFLASTVVWPTDRPDWKERPRPQRQEGAGRAKVQLVVRKATRGWEVQTGRVEARLKVTTKATGTASGGVTAPVVVRVSDPRADDQEVLDLFELWLAVLEDDKRRGGRTGEMT